MLAEKMSNTYKIPKERKSDLRILHSVNCQPRVIEWELYSHESFFNLQKHTVGQEVTGKPTAARLMVSTEPM